MSKRKKLAWGMGIFLLLALGGAIVEQTEKGQQAQKPAPKQEQAAKPEKKQEPKPEPAVIPGLFPVDVHGVVLGSSRVVLSVVVVRLLASGVFSDDPYLLVDTLAPQLGTAAVFR
jgi:hypothetical protein